MNHFFQTVCLLLAACSLVFASENGGYYECDVGLLASDNQCIMALTGAQPDDWVTPAIPHDINHDVGADFYRGVQSYTGDMLSVSPKPWVNGDTLVATAEDNAITGNGWSYALLFELIAPLRDYVMFDPSALDDATWATWTRALTDCNAKTEDYVMRLLASRSGGTPFSTDQVYGFITQPGYTDIHHYILQYLEEGAMDLVCLSTDLVMEHCDAIREAAGAIIDQTLGTDRCNCWFDAYAAIYGACPVVDMEYTTCSGTVAPTVCTGVVAVDTSGLVSADTTSLLTDDATDEGTDDETEVGEPPAKPDPTSASGR